jgi:hypothetical protein
MRAPCGPTAARYRRNERVQETIRVQSRANPDGDERHDEYDLHDDHGDDRGQNQNQKPNDHERTLPGKLPTGTPRVSRGPVTQVLASDRSDRVQLVQEDARELQRGARAARIL